MLTTFAKINYGVSFLKLSDVQGNHFNPDNILIKETNGGASDRNDNRIIVLPDTEIISFKGTSPAADDWKYPPLIYFDDTDYMNHYERFEKEVLE